MNTVEKWSAATAVVLFLIGVGVGWERLNNRIEQVDQKVASIQELLGSTTCTAILTRQIAAIERGKAEARKALEGLSEQYGCVRRDNAMLPTDNMVADYNMIDASNLSAAVLSNDSALSNELEAVDLLLNKAN